MHTDENLIGSLCKCMTCAHKRHQALEREALLREPERFQAAQLSIERIGAVIAQLQAERGVAILNRENILRDVRAAILADAEQPQRRKNDACPACDDGDGPLCPSHAWMAGR
jgi:hypothetical protein